MIISKIEGSVSSDLGGAVWSDRVGSISSGQVGSIWTEFPVCFTNKLNQPYCIKVGSKNCFFYFDLKKIGEPVKRFSKNQY